ncbi:MAG TPA: DUF5668 domain-containing protein [Thermoanaerobaculia bacterium]|nr:DUF5668 domain-containing protein [Thermoanaerobaculia bacterium]
MDDTPRFRMTEKVLFGLTLVALGAIFILDNLHLIYAGRLWDYWPLALIVPGLARVLQPGRPGQRVWGLVLVLVGTLFLLRNLDVLWVPFHRVWPFLLVLFGAYLVWQAMGRPGGGAPGVGGSGGAGPDGGGTPAIGRAGTASVAALNEFALCGGGNRLVTSSDFRGGTVTVLAGGFDIDLRGAGMTGDSVTVDLFVLMGGVVFRVPENWRAVVNVTPLLGGGDVKTRAVPAADGSLKTLIVNGVVMMGGLEIKN